MAHLKQRLDAGDSLLGCWMHLCSPMAAEIAGLTGFDFVVADHEHGPADHRNSMAVFHAALAGGARPVIRVPENSDMEIKRALDLGPDGIIVPNVNTAAEAEAAVRACRYPPRGIRGSATSIVRAAGYGLKDREFGETAHEQLVIACQIESAEAVENIAAIGAVEGVDVLFIGPSDLSGSLHKLNRQDDPQVQEVLHRAEERILASGKAMGAVPLLGRDAAGMRAAGHRFLVAATDVAYVRDGARRTVAAAKG